MPMKSNLKVFFNKMFNKINKKLNKKIFTLFNNGYLCRYEY
jgi:hypothetical protein